MRSQQLQAFLKEYDDGSLTFPNVNYRKGGPISLKFSMSEGFKTLPDGNLEWGYVRIHTGVDRHSGAEFQGVKDVVIAPFNFEYSYFEDMGGINYGTLISLFSKKYGFEFRIAHMFPKDIIILSSLKNGTSIERDTIIGTAGSYGVGAGAHTHTEVMSIGEKNEMLEELLHEKYFSDIDREYTDSEIVSYYKTQEKFKNSNAADILDDWKSLKQNRGAFFINKYLYRFKDYTELKTHTRYSSELLFGGL